MTWRFKRSTHPMSYLSTGNSCFLFVVYVPKIPTFLLSPPESFNLLRDLRLRVARRGEETTGIDLSQGLQGFLDSSTLVFTETGRVKFALLLPFPVPNR